MAYTPMPNKPSPRAVRPLPVPVGLLLSPDSGRRRDGFARKGVPDWHGLSPLTLAYLIRRYTRVGDVVLDLDTHPAVVAAVRYLRRVPAKLADGPTARVRLLPPPGTAWPRRVVCRPGTRVSLIVGALPSAGSRSLLGLSQAFGVWRLLLRPGGHLITVVTGGTPPPGRVGRRSTVIAAARAAGLLYQQHIPAVLVSLPDHDPRTDPEPVSGNDDRRRLSGGRHLPAFLDLLVLANTATGEETSRA